MTFVSFLAENISLMLLEMRLMKAVRVNQKKKKQNNGLKGAKTLHTPEGNFSFVTTSDTHGYLIHC